MEVHYSSKKHTWETPQDFFDSLNEIFNFNLDSCAETDTTKADGNSALSLAPPNLSLPLMKQT